MGDNNEGGHSLGGGTGEPLPSNWTRPETSRRIGRIGDWSGASGSTSQRNTRQLGTLRDLLGNSGGSSMSGAGAGGPRTGRFNHSDDDDDDHERHGEEGENWFAGGERSGISVQNPDRPSRNMPGGNLVRGILRRAEEGGHASDPVPQSRTSRAFGGGGHTLGSDEIESTYVSDPNAQDDEDNQETAIRRIAFYRNGFTIEDSDLMAYDDPEHAQILEQIDSGNALPSVFNIQPGQPVEIRVDRKLDEDYVPPKRSGFATRGNRLGAPVPEVSTSSSSTVSTSNRGGPALSDGERQSLATKFEVDQSKPTTSVQIRLADGTRMVCRMNLTHTVLDLRNFINASRPENLTRPYTIGTTFPNRTLDDNNETIEAAGLKNSVIVQRWV